MTSILGINAYHGDSSACLVTNGELIAAAEEERFRRIKHWAGFPSEAVSYCLRETNLGLRDIAHVAVNSDPRANLVRKIAFALRARPGLDLLLERVRERRRRATLRRELELISPGEGFTGAVHRVEHHLAHLASAFLVSPFRRAAVVSVDGFGDFASTAWGMGDGSNVLIDGKVLFPHSLGIFYMAITQYLGFPRWGDEYKVMGLAPYGEPRFAGALRNLVGLAADGRFRLNMRYFVHDRQRVQQWTDSAPHVDDLFSNDLAELLGPRRLEGEDLTQRHRDIACSAQAVYEESFFHLLNAVHRRYAIDTLALAGGCAMNSVANGKIYQKSPFKRVYIQSAAGDAGGAIGAAFHVWHRIRSNGRRNSRRFVMNHAYWGPWYRDAEIDALLRSSESALAQSRCTVRAVEGEAELWSVTAQAIAEGKVVGWFQGRMEWGPRALGNRSIICDPRRTDMKAILNSKIKRRESFRPFAPSILRDAVPEWFEVDDEVPFMMQVYQIRKERRPLIPAVTHVDGSGRLHTVTREANPRYYGLIEEFRKLTGIPMVLNTSFNENEPVVCSPQEALDCFLRTRMDVLILGSRVVTRAA